MKPDLPAGISPPANQFNGIPYGKLLLYEFHCLLDSEAIILTANKTGIQTLQTSPCEMVDKNNFDMLPALMRKVMKAYFDRLNDSPIAYL